MKSSKYKLACLLSIITIDAFSILAVSTRQERSRINPLDATNGSPEVTTIATALCVIPPETAWDTIQRARYIARDKTYHKWPPAIRLFHPFCQQDDIPDAALRIAQLVEKYEIKPFKVTLSSWVIVPHLEALEADLATFRLLPMQEPLPEQPKITEEENQLNELIAREEKIGKQRRKRRKSEASRRNPIENHNETNTVEEKESPRMVMEKQRRMYEEFNGPCVVCLETDSRSSAILAEIRAVMAVELFPEHTQFSPSSSVAMHRITRSTCTDFRALVPIGAFPTVTAAVEMARRLKAVWDPLTFTVHDFHLISTGLESMEETMDDEFSDSREYALTQVTDDDDLSTTMGQFGCDALVSLIGEEMEQDDEVNQEMVNFLLETGEPGGADTNATLPSAASLDENHSENSEDDIISRELFSWLDDDDDYDEGQVVVLGRTSFFSGEARSYVGMPASSAIDGKDRLLGDGMNAASRRRGSGAARTANLAKSGEFGFQETDHTKEIL